MSLSSIFIFKPAHISYPTTACISFYLISVIQNQLSRQQQLQNFVLGEEVEMSSPHPFQPDSLSQEISFYLTSNCPSPSDFSFPSVPQVFTVPLERRTLQSTVPQGAELQAECLLVRQVSV